MKKLFSALVSIVLAAVLMISPSADVLSGVGTVAYAASTAKKGESKFTTPSVGKANAAVDGTTKALTSTFTTFESGGYNYDKIYVNVDSSRYYFCFNIASDVKLTKGATLSKKDLTAKKSYVTASGWDLKSSSSYAFSHINPELFDDITLKFIDLDVTGKTASTIYFYVLMHSESGKKRSLEGKAKFNFKNSVHSTSSSSSGTTSGTTSSSTNKTTVSAPKASKDSGTHKITGSAKGISVQLTCSTSNTTIYYSLNGSAYKKYTSALTIDKTESTLKAYAVRNSDGVKSSVVTYNYKVAPNVTFSSTDYSGYKLIKLTSLNGASLYYTTDGSTPTTSSARYTTSGIKLTKSCTLRVLARATNKTGMIYSKSYTVTSSSGSSGGNSGSTGSTGKKGEAYFNTPSAGKADVLIDGSRKTLSAKYYSTTVNFTGSNITYNNFKIFTGSSDSQYILFNLALTSSFKKGVTLTKKDFSEQLKGYVCDNNTWKLSSDSSTFSNNDPELFDEIILKAIELDYTGATASTFYFYVSAHTQSGVKHSIEGKAKVYLNGGTSSGSSGGSGEVITLNICPTCFGTGSCNICHGSNTCQVCFGRGGQSYNTWGQGGSGWVTCTGCHGNRQCAYCVGGKCKTCGGTGRRY